MTACVPRRGIEGDQGRRQLEWGTDTITQRPVSRASGPAGRTPGDSVHRFTKRRLQDGYMPAEETKEATDRPEFETIGAGEETEPDLRITNGRFTNRAPAKGASLI